MSKLLTQAELNQLYMDFFAIKGGLKLFSHIDALTEQRDDDVKHLMAIFQECKRRAEKAEAELKRRDALAGDVIATVCIYGRSLELKTDAKKELPDGDYKIYAAPPAAGIDANHSDPDLSPGEYSVNISTKGGAAIINGVPPAVNRCQYCISNDMPKCVHGSHWGKDEPAVPDEMRYSNPACECSDDVERDIYAQGWNACRAAMLANKEQK